MTQQSFWRSFLRKYWDRRPARIEKPPIPPIIHKPELFDVLVQQANMYRNGRAPVLFRAYIDDDQYSSRTHIESLLPKASDCSLESYAARLEAMSSGKHWALILNEYHRFSELHRVRLLDFSAQVAKTVGTLAGRVMADIYVGNYLRTPFGVHKDEQHVFTWVVHGKKRILAWPFESFSDFPGVNQEHRRDVFTLPIRSNIPRMEQAMLLEGTEGDLFYWPSTFWHIAISEGQFVATTAVGFVWEERALNVISDALLTFAKTAYVNRYVQPGKLIGNQNDLYRAVRTFSKLLKSSRFDDVVEEILLARTKTIYLKDNIQCDDEPSLSLADVVRSDIRCPVVWKRRGRSLLCAVYGKHFSLKATPGIIRVLRLLNTGRPVSVARLCSLFRGNIQNGCGKQDVESEVTSVLETLRRLRFVSVASDGS